MLHLIVLHNLSNPVECINKLQVNVQLTTSIN